MTRPTIQTEQKILEFRDSDARILLGAGWRSPIDGFAATLDWRPVPPLYPAVSCNGLVPRLLRRVRKGL